MADYEAETPSERGRRGLFAPSIQRGTVARVAIRSVRMARRAAWLALQVLIALVILFEEWGWRPLFEAMGWLARLTPVARVEAAIANLRPYPALAVFVLPSVFILPLKLAALWLITGGHALAATLLFIFAKIAGTALLARIFHLTEPALMQLAWFARLYNRFIPWKDRMVETAEATRVWQVAMGAKARVKIVSRGVWEIISPVARALVGRLRSLWAR